MNSAIKIEVGGMEAAAVLVLGHRHVSKGQLVLPKNLDKVQRSTGSGPWKCTLSSSLLWPLTEVAGRHNSREFRRNRIDESGKAKR